MERRQGKNVAIIQMLMCAVLWSTGGLFIKLVPWNPLVISSFRSIVAAIVILIYLKARAMKVSVNKKTLLGGVLLCLTYICYVSANKLTTAANTIVLQYTSPVFIIIFSAAIFGKKPGRGEIAAVATTLGGISLFFLDRLSAGNALGNIAAIISGASMGAMFLLMGSAGGGERLSAVLIGQALTAVVGLPFMYMSEMILSPTSIIAVLVLGVFQLGIPYLLFSRALEHCSPLACSLLGTIEPVLNPIWVLIFTGERPGVFAVVGGLVVLFTILVWNIAPGRAKASVSAENKGEQSLAD